MANVPSPGPQDRRGDLMAFIAVLFTGIALVVFAHVTVAELTIVCTALAGLFAAWRGRPSH